MQPRFAHKTPLGFVIVALAVAFSGMRSADFGSASAATPQAGGAGGQAAAARPIRNDVPRPGAEVLVLRHQQLRKGAHEAYYQSSLEGVRPWYERLGTRIVGQWVVVPPAGGSAPAFDDAYRLARYAS